MIGAPQIKQQRLSASSAFICVIRISGKVFLEQ
jgi:hypothetical protein